MVKDRSEYQKEYYQRNKERLNEYKRDYHKGVMIKKYKKIGAYVDRDKAELFEEKLIKDKNNITDFINKAIDEYLKK